jgi:hypothetical protein
MNPEVWKGLVAGDVRRWMGPSIHRSQYDRWIGCHRRLGIELETTEYIKGTQWDILKTYQGGVGGILESHNKELQVLWDITNPVKWVNEVYDFVRVLREADIPTMGSIHCNLQVVKNHSVGILHEDVIRDEGETNIGRSECKYGPSFLTRQEFMANLLVFVANFPSNASRAQRLAEVLDPIVPDICVIKPTAYLAGLRKWYGQS